MSLENINFIHFNSLEEKAKNLSSSIIRGRLCYLYNNATCIFKLTKKKLPINLRVK